MWRDYDRPGASSAYCADPNNRRLFFGFLTDETKGRER